MHHSLEAAEPILRPHLTTLGGLWPEAWQRWDQFGEDYPDYRVKMCKRTRATILYDDAKAAAQREFDGKAPDVTLHEMFGGFLLIGFDSQLYLRLKKFRDTKTLRTSSIPTGQQQAFAAQEPLTGMPECTNLFLGYVPNADGTAIAYQGIACSTRGHLNWVLDLAVPDLGGGDVTPVRPAPDSGPQGPSLTSTIRREKEDEGIGS